MPSRLATLLLLGSGPLYGLIVIDCGYLPTGEQDRPGMMPWNTVRLGMSCFVLMFSLSMVSRYSMLMLLPPSISTREKQAARLSVARVASKTNA